MQLKKMLLLLVILIVVVGIFAFFILRQRTEKPNSIAELEQFAKLPEKPKPIAEFEHGAHIYSVAFSPVDPSLVASAGEDKTIKLWSRNNASALETTLTGHTEAVTSIVFSPTGQFLASGSLDGIIRLWDVSEKRSIEPLKHRVDRTLNPVSAVTFSPDGSWLVSAGRHVKLWDVTDIHNPTEGPTLTHDNWVQAVDFSPDGRFLAAGDQKGNVKIWDVRNEQIIKTLKRDSEGISTVKFSLDSQFLVTAGGYYISLWKLSNWCLHGTICFMPKVKLSSQDGKVPDFVPGLAFSRDGKVLASGITGLKGEMKLWSMENGAQIASLKGNTQYFTTVTFSADGTALAGGEMIENNGILRVWDVAPYLKPQQLDVSPKVRLIYFVPHDRQPQPNIRTKLDKLIKEVQQVYANEMERHGFGKKTFDFEKDENGKAVVYRIDGEFTDGHYLEDTSEGRKEDTSEGRKFVDEYRQFDNNPRNVWLIVVDISSERIGRTMVGEGGPIQRKVNGVLHAYGAYACIPASGDGFDVFTMAHELGHAFGLAHDFREHSSSEGSYIMSYDKVPPYRLSKGAAEWLDKSRFFNHNRTFFNEPSTIAQPDKTQLLFELKDMDGLRQVQLAVPTTEKEILESLKKHETLKLYPDEFLLEKHEEKEAKKITSRPGAKWKVHSYQQLKGQETDTVKFELTDLSVKEVKLGVIDVHGNIARREFNLIEDSSDQSESP